jgi:hypothetical protein
MAEKRQKLRELADSLGVKIEFVDNPEPITRK